MRFSMVFSNQMSIGEVSLWFHSTESDYTLGFGGQGSSRSMNVPWLLKLNCTHIMLSGSDCICDLEVQVLPFSPCGFGHWHWPFQCDFTRAEKEKRQARRSSFSLCTLISNNNLREGSWLQLILTKTCAIGGLYLMFLLVDTEQKAKEVGLNILADIFYTPD